MQVFSIFSFGNLTRVMDMMDFSAKLFLHVRNEEKH